MLGTFFYRTLAVKYYRKNFLLVVKTLWFLMQGYDNESRGTTLFFFQLLLCVGYICIYCFPVDYMTDFILEKWSVFRMISSSWNFAKYMNGLSTIQFPA